MCRQPPGEEEHSKEVVKSFIQASSSGSLSSFSQLSGFFFNLIYTGTLPLECTHTSAKMDLKVKVSGRSNSLWPGIVPRPLTHQKPSCARVVSPCPKRGGAAIPEAFSHVGLCPFVLALTTTLTIAMTVTLRCLQETNPGYLPCFCCHFHFRGQKGG